MHDSIEDARTALKLYHKYQDMCKDGMDKVRESLKEMYDTGRKLQWKVPEGDAPSPVKVASDRAKAKAEKKEEKSEEKAEDNQEKDAEDVQEKEK
jgi:PAB-dependent poly(A)-specific ribonuclease subunit 2